ncbi:MAG: beta-ketoacyl-ACP synthase III [Spirochaetota bacterium]
MNAYIRSVGSFVPNNRVSNHDLAKVVDTTDEWIFSHTGIRSRHFASENLSTSDLAVEAAHKAIKNGHLHARDIDMILVATATPDYCGFPATACIVQDKIGARHAAAMDIGAACTGFIYGLETAKAFVLAGTALNILVIGCEMFSKIINWEDRSTCVLFGDGAGAAVVSESTQGSASRIITSTLHAEGHGAHFLARPVGGTRKPFSCTNIDERDLYLQMDGRKVYNFAVKVLCDTITRLLDSHNVTLDDIKYIVPHQANSRIIEAAAKRKNIPMSKFYMNIEEYANTSAASIPIALDEMVEKKLLNRGDIILTIGFGSGLTYGGNLICW